MAKEGKEQDTGTTMNVSRRFAELVGDLARDADESIREYCDRELVPFLQPKVRKVIQKRLQSIDLGGEA